jgi:hypothetical protein
MVRTFPLNAQPATRNFFQLACFSRLRFCSHRLKTGRGTRDEGRSKKWEGEAPAEPETTVNGDWRLAIGK